MFSVCDSTASHIPASINEPVLHDNASADELAVHNFLNEVGIFQVNVKDQLTADQKSHFSSPKLSSHFSSMTKKSSPSFMQKRQQRIAE